MMKRPLLYLSAVSLGVGLASNASASGFALMEQSVSGLGMAFAGAAAVAEDASTIWFNPAGMTNLEGRTANAGGHAIFIEAKFTNNGSTLNAVGAALGGVGTALGGTNDDGGEDALVPNFYYAMPLNDKTWFGLGVNVPFGLSTKYQDGWVGRYHALESTLKTINISPSVAYKVNNQLSVGAGLNILYADAKLSNAIDLAGVCRGLEAAATLAAGTCAATGQGTTGSTASDGHVELTGDDIAYGLNLGMMFNPSEQTRVGLNFRSQISVSMKGRADFTNPAAGAAVWTGANLFQDTGATAKVRLPATFSASVAHDVDDQWTLLADWTRTRWSVFEELRFKFENTTQPDGFTTEEWKDSNRFSIGARYKHSKELTFRGGLAYDETPVPSAERRTARIPDSDRTWVSFGVGYKSSDNLTIDASFTHLIVDKVDINNTLEGSVATANHTLTGSYEGDVNLFSVQARYEF